VSGVASRTFVVTVGESPARIVVEDVRSGDRTVAAGLQDLASQINRWLEAPPEEPQEEAVDG
jgi:hypothetical protein